MLTTEDRQILTKLNASTRTAYRHAHAQDIQIMTFETEESEAEGWNRMQHCGRAGYGLEGEWDDEYRYACEGPDDPHATV